MGSVVGTVRMPPTRVTAIAAFLRPLYSFTIADPENVVSLFFFTITAVIASNLTARVRAQAITARQRARTTEELYQFSRKLAGAANLDDLLWATVHQIALMLKVRVVILLPENGKVAVRAAPPWDEARGIRDPRLRQYGRGRAQSCRGAWLRHSSGSQAAVHADANRAGRCRRDRHRSR